MQAGEIGELAIAAQPIWMSLAERAGVEARRSGTLVIARDAAEEAVIAELIAERCPESGSLLSGAEAARMLGRDPSVSRGTLDSSASGSSGAPRGASGPVAAAFLPSDLTADPRTAVARIAAWVNNQERGEVRFGVTALGVESGRLETSRGTIEADHIIVAAGHVIGRLLPQLADAGRVRECALQMMRVEAPAGMPLGPAVLSGTSMLRYGAFQGRAAEALRAQMARDRPELLAIDANVMFTQQADGTLLVGDSHITHDSAPPFLNEEWSRILLDEAASLLGVGDFAVLERWQGVYATSTEQDILLATPTDGVTAVTMTTGTGMTAGLGLGARTIAQL